MTKTCSKCKRDKPLSAFGSNKKSTDGLGFLCAQCRSEVERKYRLSRKGRKTRKDPARRLSENVRTQIRRSVETWSVGTDWRMHVEWTIAELATHLEKLFKPRMTWKNYGIWHLDHIRPKYSFDMPDVLAPGFKECWALENLQPLWGRENQIKGARFFATRYLGEGQENCEDWTPGEDDYYERPEE